MEGLTPGRICYDLHRQAERVWPDVLFRRDETHCRNEIHRWTSVTEARAKGVGF